jgi:signal transduction histidine kinase
MSSRLGLGSLRTRLLAAVGLLVAISLVAVGLLSSRIATREALRHLTEEEVRRADLVAALLRGPLEAHYREHGSWHGLAPLLDELAPAAGDAAVLVLDPQLQYVGCTEPRLAGISAEMRDDGLMHLSKRRQLPGDQNGAVLELLVGQGWTVLGDGRGGEAGMLVVLPGLGATAATGSQLLAPSIQRRIMVVVAVAGLLALLATWWLTHHSLAPISELTMAARAMAEGRLDHRVRVRSKDEVGRLSTAFNSMAEGLERLERLRRNMVSDVAHELRTPLTGIRCQLEALQDGIITPDRTVIDSLHEDVLALQRLVDELQELAVAEAGGLDLDLQPVDLQIEVEKLRRSMANGGPMIKVSIADLPPVQADARRLLQILRNLLANACRHTSDTVRITAKLAGKMVEVTVHDNGPGIPAEHLDLVFERFYRVDPSRQRESGGTGLGLAITRQLVQAHGGQIRAESKPGHGTSFTFTLPVARPESQVSPGSPKTQGR